MKALLHAVVGLLGIALAACNPRESSELPDADQPEIKRQLSDYKEVLPGKWTHDMSYMKKESQKLRTVIMETAKSQNSAEFSKAFTDGLDSLIEKTERNWQAMNVEFFLKGKQLKARMKGRTGNDQVFDIGCGVDPFDIAFMLPDTSGQFSWTLLELAEPHLYKDVLVWQEATRVPGSKSDLIITHRCRRVR